MKTENGHEHPWGGAEDMRDWAAELEEAGAESIPSQRSRRRPLRTFLRYSAFSGAVVVLFLAGWVVEASLSNDAPSSSPPIELSSPEELADALFPEDGVTLNVSWGNIPQRLVQEGVIDIEKFKAAAKNAGSPLTSEQLALLAEGTDEPLTIDASNAYFTLDVLWALGLANQNEIITHGPMAESDLDPAWYASTGGWTIGEEAGEKYLATLDLVRLTPDQQAVLSEVAFTSYRPCCNVPAAYPDCNHGMAALALIELMASEGAGADDIFEVLKAVYPLWFPNEYYQLALYFEHQGQRWPEVDARLVMGKEYSSGEGWRRVSVWLDQQEVPPSTLPAGVVHGGFFCAIEL